MKYPPALIALSVLCRSVAAVSEDKSYNASSGWLSFPGYDVSSSGRDEYDWSIEKRVHANPGGKGVVSNTLFVKDNKSHMVDAKHGWSLCNVIYTTKARRDSKDVDKSCKGILSDECLKALKVRNTTHDDERNCYISFGGNGTDSSACDIEGHTTIPILAEEMRKQTDGIWNLTYESSLNNKNTSGYDRSVAEVLVLYNSWQGPGEKGVFGGSVTCLGMKDFSDGSRSLDAAINASSEHLDKPESAAAALQVGWAVGVAAFLFAL